MVLGLALVLALIFGLASTALSTTGGNFILGEANVATTVSRLTASVAGPALTLVNNSTQAAATALNISVASGKAPMKVNVAAGTATNLSADELDGKDSDEILPFVRAQKDVAPDSTQPQTEDSATANTVSITAPTDGFFVISGSMEFANFSSADQVFILRAKIDGAQTAGEAAVKLRPNDIVTQAFNVTVPVSAGQHTVTSEVQRNTIGSGSWFLTAIT